jgi:hypothetical protein
MLQTFFQHFLIDVNIFKSVAHIFGQHFYKCSNILLEASSNIF